MPDLSVEVRGHEIVVTKPSQGLQVTYRKLGRSPMLMADDLMRKSNIDNDELKFLVRALERRLLQSQRAILDLIVVA